MLGRSKFQVGVLIKTDSPLPPLAVLIEQGRPLLFKFADVNPKLYTLVATRGGVRTPYTIQCLHPAPYTLHPLPYTLHPTPYTLHPTPYILHPTP